MRTSRRVLQNKALENNNNLHSLRKAARKIMYSTSDLKELAEKIGRCSSHRPCNQVMCDSCGGRIRDTNDKSVRSRNTVRATARGGARNYRHVCGQWMAAPFTNAPPEKLFAVTINLDFVSLNSCGQNCSISARAKLRRSLKKLGPTAQVRLLFDIAAKFSEDIGFPFTEGDDGPACVGPVGFLFHTHGIIYAPEKSENEIRSILKEAFPGKKRVCITTPRQTLVDSNGYESSGLAGWGEYAAMEKYELSFSCQDEEFDNVAVFLAMARFRNSWPRRSRRFCYGIRKISLGKLDRQDTPDTPPQLNSDSTINDSPLRTRMSEERWINLTILLSNYLRTIERYMSNKIRAWAGVRVPHSNGTKKAMKPP